MYKTLCMIADSLMLFTGISAKKLGELLVLRRSIKILSKRSEIDYLKNKPAQSNSQLNMPDVAHEIKISIDRLFLLILFMCITICMTEGERKVF